MTYAELKRRAEKLSPAQRRLWLKHLTEDPKFAVVVALIEEHRESYERAVAQWKLAPHHGCLEHAAGSLRAVHELRDDLAAVADHPLPKARQPEPPPLDE